MMIKASDKDGNKKIDEKEFIDFHLNVVYVNQNRDDVIANLRQELERYEQACARVFQQSRQKK